MSNYYKYNTKKSGKGKKIFLGITIGLLAVVAVGGIASLFMSKDVIDDSRVAITFNGSKDDKWVSSYVYFNHDDFEEAYQPFMWPGMMPKETVNEKDYVTYNKNNSYTIEFTSLLPPKYKNFTTFLESGGTCGVVLSYDTGYERLQSADYMITESGNHYLNLPTSNGEELEAEVVKFRKVGFVLEKKTDVPIEVNIKEDEIIYNDDLPIVIVPDGVKYNVYYSSKELEIEKVDKPTQEGKWTLHVETKETNKYNATVLTIDFELKYTQTNQGFLTPKDDMWGAGGNSVVTKADNVKYVSNDNYSYYEGSLGKDVNYITSAYLLSKSYYWSEGSFNVKAKNNITDFGTFAFWLTTCNGDAKTTKGEYTIEVLGNKKLVLGFVDSKEEYQSVTLDIDVDLTDNKYHDYSIIINKDGFAFKIDNIEYKVPNLEDKGYLNDKMFSGSEYVRVNCGLLYPQNPTWTGEIHGIEMPSCKITDIRYLNADNTSK